VGLTGWVGAGLGLCLRLNLPHHVFYTHNGDGTPQRMTHLRVIRAYNSRKC